MKLILTEKPSVAKDIAKVLNVTNRDKGYYFNDEYYITYAFGHLIELAGMSNYINHKINIQDLPIIPDKFYLMPKNDTGIKKQISLIKKLAAKSNVIIAGTDAGREGELIFRYIYDYLKLNLPIKRLWISSLTEEAIKKGFNNLKNGNEYEKLYQSAKARSQADWLIGLNSTYALTMAFNKNILLSVGRVQTPTLYLIVKRYIEHFNFKPKDYFVLNLTININNKEFILSNKNKYDNSNDAKIILNSLPDKIKVSNIEIKNIVENPPLLFDLTSLQIFTNKTVGFSAQKTLNILQQLYEKHKIVSYPRTDSRYLSDDMKNDVLNTISKFISDKNILSEINKIIPGSKNFNNNKITDHHAIIPLDVNYNLDNLNEDENKLFSIIKNRFLAAFYKKNEKQKTIVYFKVNNEEFILSGIKIINLGWKIFEKTNEKDIVLPAIKIDDIFHITDKKVIAKKTTPPTLLNDSSLLRLMETAGKEIEDEKLKDILKDKGIGTPATRSGIIELLLKRKYVIRKGKHLIPTKLGIELTTALSKANVSILSPKLTGEWEYKLNQIEKGNLDFKTFDIEIKNFTRSITKKVIDSAKFINADKILSNKIICPKCKKGVILKNSKAYYCSDKNCDFTIWETIAGKKLSKKNIDDLIRKNITGNIKGFTSKAGKKFNAKLKFNNEFKIEFIFNNKK